ncbi:hypothetical protein [Nostoc sp. NZL]|uniref:hypothetical protein n=1 Tax=Nostoc sp. NZL TaxID=2650612 RepID=UPI0018C64B34|nr:hypothetical protein [Nostoc sp. NZL]MBG1242341.1 hypothetical protein [Nostoc sp. NZL]
MCKQRYDEAIVSDNRALKLEPKFYLSWCYKARCHALKNTHDLAIESLTQAIKFRGDQHQDLTPISNAMPLQ